MSTQAILQRAKKAQEKWERLPISERLSRLAPLRPLIVERTDAIISAIHDDMGKPPLDALTGDILVTLEFLAFSETSAAKALSAKALVHDKILYWGTQFREEYYPFGVVAVLAPWNYPFQLSIVPALSALIAGNAVVLKTSEFTTKTAAQIESLFKSIDLPDDLIQVLSGDAKLGEEIINADPDFIFFTGSAKGGREVAIAAAKKLIPSILELGGKDPCIVFSDAPLTRTVEGAIYASFANCGQVCVGAKRLLIEDSILDAFTKLFLERCQKLQIGNDANSDCGYPSRALQTNRIEEYVKEAIEKGATLLTSSSNSPLKSPIVLANVSEDCKIFQEEIFGPIVCIETFSNESEAIQKVNNSKYGLGASLWTSDQNRALRVASALKVGSCSINDAILQVGNPAAPFGGVRSSGWGRYRGESGFRSFCQRRTVMERTRLHDRERHWFPVSMKTFKELKSLLSLKHGKNKILKKLFQSLSCLLLVIATVPALCAIQEPKPLRLMITEFKDNDSGELAYAIFNSEKGFPTDKTMAFKRGFVALTPRAPDGSMELKISEIPYGTYAISVYLDKNGDHKLNKNFLGIPREPTGASNNPAGRLGPPRFKDCVIEFNSNSDPYLIKLVR